MPPSSPDRPAPSGELTGFRRRAFVPTLITVSLVVTIVGSLGAPLIPVIADELDVSLGSAQWALTGTLLVAAVASPLVGRLGDGRHRKRVIMTSLWLVVLGSVLAAVSRALPILVVGRSLQGLGMALMPLTMASARAHLPARQAVPVIAALSVVGASGVGLGYPLTGFLAERFDVWSAYWAGAVMSGVAAILAAVVLPSPQEPPQRRRVDLVGAGVIGLGLVALLLAFEKAPDWGWGSRDVLVLFAAAAVLLSLWVAHELRTTDPLVDLRLVRHRTVFTANFAALMLGLSMYLALVLISQSVQLEDGIDATVFVAGLTLVPLSITTSLAGWSLPWLRGRIGPDTIVPLGSLALVLALLVYGLAPASLLTAFVTMAIVGVGLGYTFGALPGLIIGNVPPQETGSAMGFYGVARLVGFSIGSGAAVTLVRAFGDGEPTMDGYRHASLVAAGIGAVTAVVTWWLPRRGRRPAEDAAAGVARTRRDEDVPVV